MFGGGTSENWTENVLSWEHFGRKQRKLQIYWKQKIILDGIWIAYKVFGKSELNSEEMDNMSTEPRKKNKN